LQPYTVLCNNVLIKAANKLLRYVNDARYT